MIRHCDGECGKHDCYVGFLEARLTEVERERDNAHSLLQEIEIGPDYTACDYRDERANVRIYWIDSIRNKARLLLGKSTNSS